MIKWAKGICRGVSIDEAAQSENVGPNVSEIMDALTKSLPVGMSDETLKEVAEVCRSELEEFDKRSYEIATILIDELAVDANSPSIKTYQTGAEEILRHVMAEESEQQLATTVLRVVGELSQMEIDKSQAQIIVEHVIATYK